MSNIIGFLNVARGRGRNGAWFECNWPRQCRVKIQWSAPGTAGIGPTTPPDADTSVCAGGALGGECR